MFRDPAGTTRAGSGIRASRTTVTVALAVAAATATAVGLLLPGGSPAAPVKPPGAAASRPAAPARQVRAQPAVPRTTVLATVLAAVPRYASPGRRAGGPASASTVAASWYDRPSVLPVIATRPGWVRVRLPQRPNGSTAWLPASDVALGSTPYCIVVNLATTSLSLYNHGRLVFSAPAGVGTRDDPTPAGTYFVAFDEQPPDPKSGYGPFIMVTSAHSPAISDWEGSGDAVIGIHGPLGMDTQIGTKGARISHGCIRLHDAALERLDDVPAGTPVEVVS